MTLAQRFGAPITEYSFLAEELPLGPWRDGGKWSPASNAHQQAGLIAKTVVDDQAQTLSGTLPQRRGVRTRRDWRAGSSVHRATKGSAASIWRWPPASEVSRTKCPLRNVVPDPPKTWVLASPLSRNSGCNVSNRRPYR